MASITTSTGFVLTWDDTLRPGDIVTAYHKGYHRLISLTPRTESAPLARYVKVCTVDGAPSRAVEESCDASYLSKISVESVMAQYIKDVEQAQAKRNLLLSLLPANL